MSRIYWHSEEATAEVRGSERAYMGALCSRLLLATLEPVDSEWSAGGNPIRKLIPPGSYLHGLQGAMFAESFRTWVFIGGGFSESDFVYQDGRAPIFDAALNTALALGNDAVKLCARLHGQCEIHCYVEGAHRAWLAGIIEQGRAIRLFRPDQGWEDVIGLLRNGATGPVVCSYSVTEQFPDAGAVRDAGLWDPPMSQEYPDEENWDSWYDLPKSEQWRLGMLALRQTPGRGLELNPATWANLWLGPRVTGLDLRGWVNQPPAK